MLMLVKVFFLNLLNDLDNGFVLASLLRRDTLGRRGYSILCLYAALVLAATRTFYVFLENKVEDLPGARMLSGLVILIIAVRMILAKPESEGMRGLGRPVLRVPWLVKLLGLLVLTDFALCLDSVIMTAQLTDNLFVVAGGIFASVFLILLFFRRLLTIYVLAPWIQIIIAGFLTQVAVMGMSHDPMFGSVTGWFRNFFMDTDGKITGKVMDIIALDSALLVILIGVIYRAVSLFNKRDP